MGSNGIVAIPYAIAMVVLLGCSKPVKSSEFLNIDTVNGWDRPLSLTMEMEDTSNVQQIDICMRLTALNIKNQNCIPVVINMESPQGKHYTDTLELPLRYETEGGSAYQRNNGRISVRWPYRKNVMNRESGQWKFTFIPYKVQYNSIYRNISGLGISCKKEE